MITNPYINFSELSKKRNYPSPIKSENGLSLKKNGVVTVKLSNGKTITGLFKGHWGEDDDRGIFIDDYVISDNDIISIKNNIDNQINEVLRLAGVKLDEEIIHADKDMTHIVLHNPSRRELRDNNMLISRFVMDEGDNFFFGNAFDFEHEEIGDIAYNKYPDEFIVKGFYKYKSNTFLIEDSWDNEEQRIEYTNGWKEWLKKSNYFTTNFANSNIVLYDNNGHEPQLNENIVYAESEDDYLYNVILENPTIKEIKDNGFHLCRWGEGDNGYYFCDAEDMIHETMEMKLASIGINTEENIGLFYDVDTNTFWGRDDYSSEEEKEEYRQNFEKSLKKIPYLTKTFGDFKVDIMTGEFPN